ncbi:MAG: two-component sensor histidine kinase, partial [Methylophaga sp.]|nr:two-component sensor histidine kinase [Methylophaga sp.]
GLGKSRTLEEYRELLYSNLEEQERLAKMINDMLWLAKSDHGLIKLEPTPLDLSDEVKALFGFFEALAEDHKVALTIAGQA